jgi:probable F420-dependent oxidoreductase
MKFGASLPQLPRDGDPDWYLEYARTAEDLGFHHVVAPDHVVAGNPETNPEAYFTAEDPFHEPLTTLASLASVTDELRLVTGILILPQRQTALVAKQAAEVDWLSGGRLRLGVGVGWNEVEYEALGLDFHTRGRRMAAQVEVLRRLWTEELVEVDDDWHSIPDAGLNPLPIQQPVPIWMGGGAEPVLRRIARQADGWAMPGVGMEKLTELRDRLSGYLDDEGRSLDDLALLGRMDVGDGGPGEWAERVREWQEFGATHVMVNPRGANVDLLERLEAVKDVF